MEKYVSKFDEARIKKDDLAPIGERRKAKANFYYISKDVRDYDSDYISKEMLNFYGMNQVVIKKGEVMIATGEISKKNGLQIYKDKDGQKAAFRKTDFM